MRQKEDRSAHLVGLGVIALLLACLCTSCACWGPKKDAPACIVLHQVIDCSGGAVASNIVPVVVAIVESVIAGQTNVDWGGVLARLEGAGIKDAGCILAALEADFGAHPSPASASFSVAFTSWKAKHGLTGVKFKLAGK